MGGETRDTYVLYIYYIVISYTPGLSDHFHVLKFRSSTPPFENPPQPARGSPGPQLETMELATIAHGGLFPCVCVDLLCYVNTKRPLNNFRIST